MAGLLDDMLPYDGFDDDDDSLVVPDLPNLDDLFRRYVEDEATATGGNT
jgi:hypothetical protein